MVNNKERILAVQHDSRLARHVKKSMQGADQVAILDQDLRQHNDDSSTSSEIAEYDSQSLQLFKTLQIKNFGTLSYQRGFHTAPQILNFNFLA
jgi:hypothetical protein